MKNKSLSLVILLTFVLEMASLFTPSLSQAANLTAARDILQSSRMSFNGRVKSPTVSGSSHVWIYTVAAGNATSVSTAGLKPGDSVVIGGTNSYIIGTIIDADEFTITTTLASGDADDTDVIYYKAKPMQMITFNTASAVNGGFFRVLIPAAVSGSNDTIPDIAGFDFNSGVTATASSVSGYTFVAGVATASGGTDCTSTYHCFEFHYTGTGGVGTAITLYIGLTAGTNTMIAPAPSSGRIADTADAYTFKVQNFTNGTNPQSGTPTDDVSGRIAVIEPVRVTATVAPSITFKIEGVAASASVCNGLTTDVLTTGTSVPFGDLILDTFKIAAQKMTVSTNASTGYVVTAIQNNRMSNFAGSPSYIPDTTCDTGGCTHTTSAAWATASGHSGFGYTTYIASGGGTPTIAPTAPNYQHFPNATSEEAPFQIMSNSTIASSQAINICYKIAVDATQPAGNYENQVTYTATATF